MGSRGRSIRLRIYFLVAIPLVAMIGLLAYVAGTSIDNAINLDRAPSLINATSLPTAKFVSYLQTERAAAVVYLFEPTPANLQAYDSAIAATNADEPAFVAAMNSPATVKSETPSEYTAITGVVSGVDQLGTLRTAVKAQALSPLAALTAYSQGIAAEPRLFLVMANSESDTSQLGQAMGLIATVQAREQLSQEDALLSGMLAGKRMTAKDRVALTGMAATRQADTQYADGILSPANLALYNASLAGSGSMQQTLAGVEQAIAAGTPVAALPVSLAQWQQLTGTLLQDQYRGGVAVANAILTADHQTSRSAWIKVAVTGGIALLGLLITLVVTTLVGRGIIRRLRGLERSAIALASDQLPDVLARLRRSEEVDVAAEAPPLEVGHGLADSDEIGRVGQAFDLVRQTAIQAAVDEAKLRRGINDVFRSLARRSQSLLHRQLTLLDQMERRATDPEALDDLFRLDHLTTRMRRHAEGLVILAGAPPGRGWSSPVRMVDVMRGAIAEVEDYARVSVATRSQAALSGSAVADVIHLLAELIENATTLSPPYTSVRVAGETVANGFAIEVEDRGLGMNPQRLAELNERLANPPEFNPSESEQLGLFVVGQLAKRHSILVTLKASPYGGTSAVVLIPRHLVVTEEAFRAGLPGEPAAIAMTPTAVTNGNHPVGELSALPAPRTVPGLAEPPGVRISGPLRRAQGNVPDGTARGARFSSPSSSSGRPGADGRANPAGPAGPVSPVSPLSPLVPLGPADNSSLSNLASLSDLSDFSNLSDPEGLPRRARGRQADSAAAAATGAGTGAGTGVGAAANGAAGPTAPVFDVFMPRRRSQDGGETPVPGDGGLAGAGDGGLAGAGDGGLAGAGDGGLAGDGVGEAVGGGGAPRRGDTQPNPVLREGPRPVAGRTPVADGAPPYPAQPASFSGWTGQSTVGAPVSEPGQAGPRTPMTPVASPRTQKPSGPPWELSRQTGPMAAVPDDPAPDADGGVNGLPRRVKQANLHPQLRGDPPQRLTAAAGPSVPPGGPTPAEIRQTMSALQRGWEEGRTRRPTDGDPGPAGPAAAGANTSPGADPAPGQDTQAPGGADGT